MTHQRVDEAVSTRPAREQSDADELAHLVCCRSDWTRTFCGLPCEDDAIALSSTFVCTMCLEEAHARLGDRRFDGTTCPEDRRPCPSLEELNLRITWEISSPVPTSPDHGSPRVRPLTAVPAPTSRLGAAVHDSVTLRGRRPVRDAIVARCVGWSVLTGASSGAAVMVGAELDGLRSGSRGFEAAWVPVGAVAGAIVALPVGLVISLAAASHLRALLASSSPQREVRLLFARIVVALDALVVLAASPKAVDFDAGNWGTFLGCLLAANLGAWPVLALAAVCLTRRHPRPGHRASSPATPDR